MRNQELSRAELARAVGHQRVSGAINRALKELLPKALVEMTIPEKRNSRLQKYRLTDAGKRLLKSVQE